MSRFLTEHLPDTRTLLADYRTRLRSFPEPVKPEPGGSAVPWGMLGRTIDHRLRICLGTPTGEPIKMGVPLALIDDDGFPAPEVRQTAREAGLALIEELRPYHQDTAESPLLLTPEAEDRLVRLCFIASHFEEIYRCGGFVRGSWLGYAATPGTTLEDLITAVPPYVVDDIGRQMARAARPGPFEELRRLPAEQKVCGPVFAGSNDLGGADADFILAGRLVDCKATVRPERIGRAAIHQLAGYLLLDYDDAHHIDRVALYLSRQGALLDWSVDDFLGLLGARLSLPQLRAACRHTLTGGTAGTPPPPPDQRNPPRPRTLPPEQDTLFDDFDDTE